METNVKAVKSLRNTTITISTIAIIVAIVLTIGVILVFAGGSKEGYMAVIPLAEKTDQLSDRGLLAIGAGISCIGMLGAGIGQGYAGGKAAEAVGRNPEAEGKIRNMMIVGAAIAESSALYALVIAIMCLFVA